VSALLPIRICKVVGLVVLTLLVAGCETTAAKPIVINRTPAEIEAAKQAYNSAPLLLERTNPVYPKSLRAKKIAGDAIIEFYVERDGTVGQTRVLSSSNDEFGTAATACIKSWRFIRGNFKGKAARTRMSQQIIFAP
jgi:TonB family protein